MAHRTYSRALLVLLAGTLALGAARAQAQIAPPGQGGIHALVIGIDRYTTRKSLRGAVADARDIEQSLRKAGIRDLTVLIDEKATRRDAVAAIDRLIDVARPGDLVIITFAGHGSQSPERVKGSDPDGVDEVFLLSAFDDKGQNTAERLLDKELNKWLARIEQKGAHTLFLADTCHGGGLTRNVDPRAVDVSYREAAISIEPLGDALAPDFTSADRMRKPEEFDRVTFLAAVDKWTKAPEVRIPGQPTLRGALSYAVARALEGEADRSKDGRTTRRELFEYARQVVQQYAQGRQNIYTEPVHRTDLMDAVVFRGSGPPERAPSTEAQAHSTVRLAVINGSGADVSSLHPDSARVEVVARNQQPDLVWDATSGDVVSGLGDVVAKDIRLRDLAGVIDRTAAIAAIARLSEKRPQRIVLLPNDKHHRKGERITFRTENVKDKAIILFNIASNGFVQFLYPNKNDRSPSGSERVELSDIEVRAPFGADHVVAIVSDRRLPALEQAIKDFDQVLAAGRLPAILQKHLADEPSIRIGYAGLFTVP